MVKKILALVTHPDDAEFLCAGTMALLGQAGCDLIMATMTAGDCGSKELAREEISSIRKKEAAQAAAMIQADYHCLEFDDMFITYDRASILKVLAFLRKIAPEVVITMSPDCYMVDHEITSTLVRTACFAAGMTNMDTPGESPFEPTPYLYYLDPIEGKDKLGNKIEPATVVDISTVIDLKSDMLACHASQREWLQKHHRMDQYLIAMREQAAMTGEKIGVAYGEGFRQHLGHAYPQHNILAELLPATAKVR